MSQKKLTKTFMICNFKMQITHYKGYYTLKPRSVYGLVRTYHHETCFAIVFHKSGSFYIGSLFCDRVNIHFTCHTSTIQRCTSVMDVVCPKKTAMVTNPILQIHRIFQSNISHI